MMRHAWTKTTLRSIACCCALLCVALPARAQDEQDEEEEEAESAAPPAAAEAEPSAPAAPPSWFFGAYFQGQFVPSFMLKLFLAEAPTVSGVGVGITATHRSADGPSFVLGLGWAGYSFDGAFRSKGDPDTDTEYLHSTLGLLHARFQVLWSAELVKDTLSLDYGIGADVGIILGQLTRTEAYPLAGGGYGACLGPGNPVTLANYCDPPVHSFPTDAYNQDGAHYNVVEKRVPPVMLVPMLPVLALRYTPLPQLAIKLDAAFGLAQFYVGLSAGYGVNL